MLGRPLAMPSMSYCVIAIISAVGPQVDGLVAGLRTLQEQDALVFTSVYIEFEWRIGQKNCIALQPDRYNECTHVCATALYLLVRLLPGMRATQNRLAANTDLHALQKCCSQADVRSTWRLEVDGAPASVLHMHYARLSDK